MTGTSGPFRLPDDQPYWDAALRHELRVQSCDNCKESRFPSAPVCPSCLSEASSWKLLSGKGRIFAWTRFHRTYLPAHPAPYVVVSVETEEGVLLIGKLAKGEPSIGQVVRAVFETIPDPEGDWAICQWESESYDQNGGSRT